MAKLDWSNEIICEANVPEEFGELARYLDVVAQLWTACGYREELVSAVEISADYFREASGAEAK